MAPLTPVRILLLFHSTRSDNLGVGALTQSEVTILRDIGARLGRAIEITVLDWKDTRSPYVTGGDIRVVELDRRMMLSPRGFFALARRADLAIDIGGGDSFADIYGTGRLKRMFWLKTLTHLAGTPLVMAPQTIGPFDRTWSRRLARGTMRRCALVASRDRLSTEAARGLGVAAVIEASDVALRLPGAPPPPRPAAAPLRVGINVSGLLMAGGYTGRNEFGIAADYPTLMRDLIRHFQAHPAGCEVHLVPHVIVRAGPMQREDDAQACAGLAAEFPGTVLAPAFATPSEAKGYISGMDFFMGARMHACIAAFSSGVPVVPMAYSRKFAGMFGSLGYNATVDCTVQDGAAILTWIAAAFEDRATLARDAAAALALGLEKLGRYEAALEAQISRC